MYSKAQIKKANESIVHKIKEVKTRIHFEVIYNDKKGEHKHHVIFIKNKKFPENFNCDCSWCSFYGRDKKTKKLIKLCYNCLAVSKKMNLSL